MRSKLTLKMLLVLAGAAVTLSACAAGPDDYNSSQFAYGYPVYQDPPYGYPEYRLLRLRLLLWRLAPARPLARSPLTAASPRSARGWHGAFFTRDVARSQAHDDLPRPGALFA